MFKENYRMLNLGQLQNSIDTSMIEMMNQKENTIVFSKPYYAFNRFNLDSVSKASQIQDSVLISHTVIDSSTIVSKAINTARNLKSYVEFTSKSMEGKLQVLRRYQIEWWRKFTLSFACFVLFLIGASLGAIIRKGGFGLPFVISILFFIIFYVLSIAGEKMSREGVLSPATGMWFSSMFLFPLAIFFMYKANRDSILFNMEAYKSFFIRVFGKKKTEKV
jgi:lipopolysaccharide export system permease protein